MGIPKKADLDILSQGFRVAGDWAGLVAHQHGFWDHERSDSELIALMHSELSEALEGSRQGNPRDEHCPKFSSMEIEMADLLIRVFDAAWHLGWRLAEAFTTKMEVNEARPHKHGKKF